MSDLSKFFKQAYIMKQLRNAPKTSKMYDAIYSAGFDSPDHLINYLQKSFEDFSKLPKQDQYAKITRSTYNTNPNNFSSPEELRKALIDRSRNAKITRKVPKEYANIEEFSNVSKKTPRYEIDDLVTQFLEKDKVLNPQYQDKIDVATQDLIDAYNSRQFDREAEDYLAELERTAPKNTKIITDFEPTTEKFKPVDQNLRKMLDEIEYKGKFIRESQTTPDVDVQIDTTELKQPRRNTQTVRSLDKNEYKKVLDSLPNKKRYHVKKTKYGYTYEPTQTLKDALLRAETSKYYKELYKRNKNIDQIPFQELLKILEED